MKVEPSSLASLGSQDQSRYPKSPSLHALFQVFNHVETLVYSLPPPPAYNT